MSDASTGQGGLSVGPSALVDALRVALGGGMLASRAQGGAAAPQRGVDPAIVPAVRASAARLGVDPADLLTAMSYETGGTMNPNIWGGKGNNYFGLIQFGPQERAKYGVKPGMPVADQVTAAENFLRDRGVRPGMGLLDIYSTINAGAPGLYNRSDAGNGGAPGTVYDKVTQQMRGHQARAQALLAAQPDAPRPPADIPNAGPSPQAAAPAARTAAATGAPLDLASFAAPQRPQSQPAPAERAPFSLAPPAPEALADLAQQPAPGDYGQGDLAQAMLAQQASTEGQPVPLNPIAYSEPPGLAYARMQNMMSNPALQLRQRLIAAMAAPQARDQQGT